MIIDTITKAQKGNTKARNEVLLNYNYIIDRVVNKLGNNNMDDGAKRYGAILGILSAIQHFDKTKGAFKRFAYKCALQRAKREMSKDWLIRHPVEHISKALAKKQSPYQLMSISEAYDKCKWYTQTDPDGKKIIELSIPELIVYDKIEDTHLKKIMMECINELTELEKDAIYYKYGFTQTTLKNVGKKYNVSHEWVRLKCNSSFIKIKKILLNKLNRK